LVRGFECAVPLEQWHLSKDLVLLHRRPYCIKFLRTLLVRRILLRVSEISATKTLTGGILPSLEQPHSTGAIQFRPQPTTTLSHHLTALRVHRKEPKRAGGPVRLFTKHSASPSLRGRTSFRPTLLRLCRHGSGFRPASSETASRKPAKMPRKRFRLNPSSWKLRCLVVAALPCVARPSMWPAAAPQLPHTFLATTLFCEGSFRQLFASPPRLRAATDFCLILSFLFFIRVPTEGMQPHVASSVKRTF